MSKLDGTEPTPIRPVRPLTLEERFAHLEAQQLAMASSMLRSMSAIDKHIVDTDAQLRWLSREIRSIQVSLWLLAALNVSLLAALSVMILLYLRQ